MNHHYQHLVKPSPRHNSTHIIPRSRSTHTSSPIRRIPPFAGDGSAIVDGIAGSDTEGDTTLQDDPLHVLLKDRFSQSESKIERLFRSNPNSSADVVVANAASSAEPGTANQPSDLPATIKVTAARTINDDYGDDDEDDDEAPPVEQSPLLAKVKPHLNGTNPQLYRSPSRSQSLRVANNRTSSSAAQNKDVAEVRKELEEHKIAAEQSAKRSFHTAFYTFESDRHAMLEQQKLDELDRQMESEMSNSQAQGPTGTAKGQGSLSSADLGASSLTLKHLIARIDLQRTRVKANDTQLRSLISEVRKGRSKWASEDKVGQEELYEAAEKVLMELKAMTEYSTPFLQRVNKRDAPNYHQVIKYPMDMGTMIKKLKSLQYKSKKDFVSDLNYIWSNCLTYNAEPSHPIRRKALYMRKETDKLVPLIPDITVRDRAEVEAEEERNHALENGLDGGDDSEDDLPIMASRGRKAPSKGKPGEKTTHREEVKDTAAESTKPVIQTSASSLRNEFLRNDADAGEAGSGEAGSNGLGTPPPGSATPQTNGLHADTSMTEVVDVDAASSAIPTQEDVDENDAEYITWRQVTKKDRATAAADRNRLFQDDRINAEEPALLRSKAGMRRWLRQQKQFGGDEYTYIVQQSVEDANNPSGATLAEGIEQDEDRTLPDYYDTLTAIPNLDRRLGWVEDNEGQVVPHNEQYMRMFPAKSFVAPGSVLCKRLEGNMRQMQDTRKICAKIGVVKQMQIQAQACSISHTYQNQFQKYEPEPFVEQDVEPLAASEDGPIMSPWICRAAFQRSVGRLFYHAGFEDFHPSALEAMTDVASSFLTTMATSLTTYMQAPQTKLATGKFTAEEQVLHCLHENGIDLDTLETYVTEDVERLGSKLTQVHDRLRSHLADLLRPALGEGVGADGEGAFNDGSEQFVGGDFAEDIDEDFFGFKELGLADELGLQAMSVPLHLLQNRVHNAYAAGQQNAVGPSGLIFPPPQPYEAVTTDSLPRQLGLVQEYFASKLATNNGRALVEDQDLPPKQRFPKPRLGPAGKISSPRKRPLREQQQLAKKKRKMEENNANGGAGGAAGGAGGAAAGGAEAAGGANKPWRSNSVYSTSKPLAPLKLDMPTKASGAEAQATTNGLLGTSLAPDPEKVNMAGNRPGGPLTSPEAIAAN